jgi:hypothetical protein
MEVRKGRTEDLPPLALRELRTLELDAPVCEGGPSHLSAASGVVRRGGFLYVIGDDIPALGVFGVGDPVPGCLQPVFEGERLEGKPDLEALTLLPPFEGAPYGALLGLGSGSAEGRHRGFVWALQADGSTRGEPRTVDLAPLYERLAKEVEHLNVEGACVMGEHLWLLHRGNHRETTNVVAELALDAVMASLHGDLRIDVEELARVRSYDLGTLDDVKLTFSDATPLDGRVLVFTASAEGDGGSIHGSVIGTIDLEGDVKRLRTIDRRFKVEGVHAAVDTGVMDLVFVCDQDDPDTPSPLLSATMPVDGRFEAAAARR